MQVDSSLLMSLARPFLAVAARIAVAHGRKAPEHINTSWDRAILAAEAAKHPHLFKRCKACGSGPWHNSWMSWDGQPGVGIGPCCSGAD